MVQQHMNPIARLNFVNGGEGGVKDNFIGSTVRKISSLPYKYIGDHQSPTIAEYVVVLITIYCVNVACAPHIAPTLPPHCLPSGQSRQTLANYLPVSPTNPILGSTWRLMIWIDQAILI
ncbi:MAG: hypothetical protein ACI9G1_000677 [Pirellulaceae bacterium]|jgi:hypothetical protein